MTSKLFVAFVFNLFIRAERYSLYFTVNALQTKQTKTYINRTGGNTNRCNFQTPFSLWLCFLLFQKTDNKLIEMSCFRFVSACSFAAEQFVQIANCASLDLHFFQLEYALVPSGRKYSSNIRDNKRNANKSSLKPRPNLISSQNILRAALKPSFSHP